MSAGWVPIHRQIKEWEWYDEGNTFRLFMHLLLTANHKDGNWRGSKIPAGSLITGRKKLAVALKLSEQNIRTSLDHLKSTNEITIKTTKEYSLISITNWNNYQPTNQPTNQPSTNHQPTANQPLTTNNNVNNVNNEIKDQDILKNDDDKLSINEQIKMKPKSIDDDLWKSFVEARKERKAVQSKRALNAAINELKKIHDAGINIDVAINEFLINPWKSLKIEYITGNSIQNNAQQSSAPSIARRSMK